MSIFQTSDEDIISINNNSIPNEENYEDMKTKEMELHMCDPNKVCDYCLMMKKNCGMMFFEQVKICEECLVKIIVEKVLQFPTQPVKLINGCRVFFLTVKSRYIKLYFRGVVNNLPNNRKKEIQFALNQYAMQLSSDIDNKCKVCGELIKLIDNSVMKVKIDSEYNYNMSLFSGNNYNKKDHLVCYNCYKIWLDQTITLNFKGSLSIMSMCALCKGVEHKCTYEGDIKQLKWYDETNTSNS